MLAGLSVGFVFVFVLEGAGVHENSGSPSTASAVLDIVGGAFSIGLALVLLTGHDPRPARLKRKRKPAADPGKRSRTQRP